MTLLSSMSEVIVQCTYLSGKITPSVDYNKWSKRYTFNLIYQPIQIQTKSPRLLNQRIRKHYFKTIETTVL